MSSQEARLQEYGKLPLAFEENKGQWDGATKFLARGAGYRLFLTANGSVMGLRSGKQESVLRTVMVGADPEAAAHGLELLAGKVNYFRGSDPAAWRTGVQQYRKVHYRQVYPGVDVIYYGNQGQLEYDFLVAPGLLRHSLRHVSAHLPPQAIP